MHKFFVKEDQITNNQIIIIGKDVLHIKDVLRLNVGSKLQICNIINKENFICEICEVLKEKIKCNIIEKINSNQESNIHINIFQGVPKFEKMELIIQKNVELGASEITPVIMKRTVVKLDEKSKIKKIERWQKISETAAKQSKRDIIPKVNDFINIKDIIELANGYDLMLLAYEEEKYNTLKDEIGQLKKDEKLKIGIIIGPEGGLEKEEVDILKRNNIKVVTLGKRILRTETASIAMTSIIMYELE